MSADQQAAVEPSYTDEAGVFWSPVHAAAHAVHVQGGFSTPEIEAQRMLADGGEAAVRASLWAVGDLNLAKRPPVPAPPATSDWTSLPDSGLQPDPPSTGRAARFDTDRAKEYARLRRVQAAREEDAKAAKKQADEMEAQLIEELLAAGVDRITVDGTLLFTHTTVAASKLGGVSPEQFHAALRAADLAEFIKPTVSASTLSAFARDLRDAEKDLPPELAEVMQVVEITKLRTQKAAAKKGTRTR